MVIPYCKTAAALAAALMVAATPTLAATPSAAAPAQPASAAGTSAATADADLGVAHPVALVVATIAAISFVTRRLRN